ncbi:hypothetical protein AAVH_25813 [Aphelenchoides avenae]|nr:hypothetical protein AAVH_25813 [Aphelenchus avenae]
MPAKRACIEKKHKRRDAKKNPAVVDVVVVFNYSDDLSLFRAVLSGVFYYENGKGTWEAAERYARSSNRTSREVAHLWNLIDKPLEQASYSMDDVKKVYEYLDTQYPETYRILVFTDTSGTHTVYNSGNNAKHTICLYYNHGNFDLIKTPQKFFRKKHYCVDCEKTYENLADHTNCRIRCRLCFRVGYGYPCKGDMDLECKDCHKLFPTMECMDANKPYSCNTYHRCVYCNTQYRVRPERPRKGHGCAKAPATVSIASEPASVPAPLQQDGW